MALFYLGMCASAWASEPAVDFPAIGARQSKSRTVELSWWQLSTGASGFIYEVYRDGEKYAEFEPAVTGRDEKGNYYTQTYPRIQVFTDYSGVPGREHEYLIVARLEDGRTAENTVTVAIPSVAGTVGISWKTGRKVEMWSKTFDTDLHTVSYEIRRDGELLAEFPYGSSEVARVVKTKKAVV
jgi:hypothetical protein